MVIETEDIMDRTAAMAEETAEVIPVALAESFGRRASAFARKDSSTSAAAEVSAVTFRLIDPADPPSEDSASPESFGRDRFEKPEDREAKISFRPEASESSAFRSDSARRAEVKEDVRSEADF